MKTLTIMLALLVCLSVRAYAQTPPSVRQLVRQADFVGFVQAEPLGIASQGEWRQSILLTNTEAIKGGLSRDFGSHQYPWVKADHVGVTGYPTHFGETGEYLVFLRGTGTGLTARWTTLAAYHVQYYPDGLGGMLGLQPENVVGLLTSSESATMPPVRSAITMTEARRWLGALALGQSLPKQEEVKMVAFFHASLLSTESSRRHVPPTHEERLALAKKLAEAITLGTTRAQVEKIFPDTDGGVVSSEWGRYYFGSEVMISVPYDTNGGPFQPENKVKGSLRVYRDMMHID